MKHLKLFEFFHSSNQSMFDGFFYNTYRDVIRDRLIDLNDNGYLVDMISSGTKENPEMTVVILKYHKSERSELVNLNNSPSFRVSDIMEDLLAMISELDSMGMKYVQCKGCFSGWEYVWKRSGAPQGQSHIFENDLSKIEGDIKKLVIYFQSTTGFPDSIKKYVGPY
jgi:hypothetical protein